MGAGKHVSPLSPDQRRRLQRSVDAAARQSGIPFAVQVGDTAHGVDPDIATESLLAGISDEGRQDAVLIVVRPGDRQVQIRTTPSVRRRINDQAAALAVLGMTSSFAVGDLIGGIVNGLRQLADAAGHRPLEHVPARPQQAITA